LFKKVYLKKILHSIVSFFLLHFRPPVRGLKYFLRFLAFTGLSSSRFIKKLPVGIQLELGSIDHIEQTLLWYGWYEKNEFLTFYELLQPNSVVIDVGTNLGYYSIAAAAKFNTVSVISFEPGSNAFQRLQKNIALNQLKNITPIQQAIGREEGKKTLYLSGEENTGMSGFEQAENFTGKTEIVNCTSIDKFAGTKSLEKLDLIKIDIEGSEMDVLNGMTNTLTSYKPIVLIEICTETLQRFHQTPANIHRFLTNFGYQGYKATSPFQLYPLNENEDTDLAFFLPAHYQTPNTITIKS
jgi:FkbM family methyltransferase